MIPPLIVIYGDEEYQKSVSFEAALNRLLPPQVDRSLALCVYEGAQRGEAGELTYATVVTDLATLPFLSERRVVVVRDADTFISAWREKLEGYLAKPAPTGTLILTCRSFPKTTRLYKAADACGGELIECKKLSDRALVDFVSAQVRERGKQIDPATAARLADLVGADQGVLTNEIEKLCLYVGERTGISDDDVSDLVGRTREEKIFAVMDAAGAGNIRAMLRQWQHLIMSDSAAIFMAVGGIAFVLRKWITAHRMAAEGLATRAIAPKVMMWGRERELDLILSRLSARRVGQYLCELGELDAQAKSGVRSIDTGVELLLLRIATAA